MLAPNSVRCYNMSQYERVYCDYFRGCDVWGLVVNEALYSGLKVVVGDRCGCVPDLVINGKNGYTFHSGDINDLKNKLILASRI